MSCTSPRTVGFRPDGKTISWSPKTYSKEYAPFQLPCGKCIECRLSYAKMWAIRCVHEAQMHENNIFATFTYGPELKNPKLHYPDFQLFMRRLRKTQDEPIGMFVTGEYGELNKRPHWHAIIFNYLPKDQKKKYTNKRGDTVYESETLTKLWGRGTCDFGSVTLESAGYVARYSLKKLLHGDQAKEYEPISKKSSKYAIGKAWIEKYYQDVFDRGELILKDGTKAAIPRYYVRWFAQHYPSRYHQYVTVTRSRHIRLAEEQAAKAESDWLATRDARVAEGKGAHKRQREIRKILANEKFKLLHNNLKL